MVELRLPVVASGLTVALVVVVGSCDIMQSVANDGNSGHKRSDESENPKQKSELLELKSAQ
jgi:hypothetical protein